MNRLFVATTVTPARWGATANVSNQVSHGALLQRSDDGAVHGHKIPAFRATSFVGLRCGRSADWRAS